MSRTVCGLFGALCLFLSSLGGTSRAEEELRPPKGFTALFNGKDLTGWHGMPHFDPYKLATMAEAERKRRIEKWTDDAKKHWTVKDGELVNDGKGAYLTTDKEFGDIELLVEYKTVPKADSGIYLRATPQVQIWDYTKEGGKWDLGADKGSGGLWNNSENLSRPRSARAGRQAVRRMEHVPHPPGRRTRSPSTSTASWSSITPGWRTSGTASSPLRRTGPDPAADARRRDPLAQHLHPRDPGGRGQRDPPQARRRRLQGRLQRQGFHRLGRADGELRGQGRRHRLQAEEGRQHLHQGGVRATSSPASSTACRRAATTAWRSAIPARASPRPSPCARCRFSTTAPPNTRSSTRASTTARPTAWSRRTAATCGRSASGISWR